MVRETVQLTVMDKAHRDESSDAFGFHYARVSHIQDVRSSKDLLQLVLSRSFMHAVCLDWRKSENLQKADWLVWDVDAHYSVGEITEKLKRANYKFWIVSSLNHQKIKTDRSGQMKPACDRFRVILPLETSIQKKDDYSYTSKSLCKELALRMENLDPASFSISGRWQPGRELLAQRLDGRPVKALAAPAIRRKSTPDMASTGKGRLRQRTLNFLNGQLTKGWHYDLLFACADLKSALYSHGEAISELEKATGGKGLDRHHDLYQIDYVYHRSSFHLDYLSPFKKAS